MQIQDRVFVITGGARGLGLAMAQEIASKGGRCALIDLDEDGVIAAAAACGNNSRGYPCNIAEEAQVEAVFS